MTGKQNENDEALEISEMPENRTGSNDDDSTEGLRKRLLQRRWFVPLIIGMICFVIVIFLSLSRSFRMMEFRTFDWRMGLRHKKVFSSFQAPTHKKNPDILVVPVDDKTLDELKDPLFFWTRHFALVFEKLLDNGAKVIALDYQFQTSADDYFKKKFRQVIQKMAKDRNWKISEEDIGAYMPRVDLKMASVLRRKKIILPVFVAKGNKIVRPHNKYAYSAGAIGHEKNLALVNKNVEQDGVARKQFLYRSGKDQYGNESYYFIFALLAARKYLDKKISYNPENNKFKLGDKRIPTDRDGEIFINYVGPPGAFIGKHSFSDLVKKANENDNEYFKKNFAGKVILIGPGYQGSNDLVVTPYNALNTMEMFGVEVHANLLNTLLNRDYIRKAPKWVNRVLLFIVTILLAFLCYYSRPAASIASGIVVGAAVIVLCFAAMYKYNTWLYMIPSLTAIPVTFASVYTYRYMVEDRKKRFIRKVLGRYLSESVASEILKDPAKLALGGQRRDVSILFCDINDFTTFSEKTPPEEVIAILNEYFTRMEKVIFENRGTLKQFVGDEIMVICGAPQPDEDHAFRICKIGMEMIAELRKWQWEKLEKKEFVFDVKFGMHSGQVVAGNVGSPNRTEYTTIGDVVNTASRIMGLTKKVKASVLISEETYERAKDRLEVEEKGEFPVKGREEKVKVYELKGIKNKD